MEEEMTTKHLNIKALAKDDRPREKLVTLGRHNLSDSELIAIVLGSGSRTESAMQLARRILSDNQNNINRLAKLSLSELRKYRGVGLVKAINIAAAFELGRRRTQSESLEKVKIISSYTAYQLLQKRLSDLPHEEFWILILNRANQVIKEECLSKGGISGTVIDARLVCKAAIENNASAIIVAHNHPSGQLIASEQDKAITSRLKEALGLFDVVLMDHLIIGDLDYLSFADSGLMEKKK